MTNAQAVVYSNSTNSNNMYSCTMDKHNHNLNTA